MKHLRREELPIEYQETNAWLTDHHHGIPWNTPETTPYDDIERIFDDLLCAVNCVYVKGLEKKKWLEALIKNDATVVNLEDWGCPKLADLKGVKCWKHRFMYLHPSTVYHCAMQNVLRLRDWHTKYLGGCIEKSLKKFCQNGKYVRKRYIFSPQIFSIEICSTQH